MTAETLVTKQKIRTIADELTAAQRLPLVEIHILRPVAGELLNRGFDGRHKTLDYGGTTRNRFSSQSLKQAIRISHMKEGAYHTRMLPTIVKEALAKRNGVTKEYISDVAPVIDGIVKKTKPDARLGTITSQIMSISREDVQAMVDAILAEIPVGTKPAKTEDAVARIRKVLNDSAETRAVGENVALLGRMSTDDSIDTVYSAVHMNHAYSVNEASGDVDDYTAVDDYLNVYGVPDNDSEKTKQSGSAYMESTDIAANVYYQYASVSTRILFENLMRGRKTDQETVHQVLENTYAVTEQFLKDMIFILPGAKQNSMATVSVPRDVYITVGTGVYPSTLDDIYERTIYGNGSKSVADQAAGRLMRKIVERRNGAFAVNEYETEYWISDVDPAPDRTVRIRVQELSSILEA